MVDEQKGRLKEETVAAGVSLMQNAILVLQVWNIVAHTPLGLSANLAENHHLEEYPLLPL